MANRTSLPPTSMDESAGHVWLAFNRGPCSISVIQRQHSRPRQLGVGTTVHCSVQYLEAVDLTFGLTVVLREFDCISCGINIPVQNAGGTHDCRQLDADSVSFHSSSAAEFLLCKMPLKRMAKPRMLVNTVEPCFKALTFLA